MRIRDKSDYIPAKYCLGMGHFKFFVDKGHFTYNRYQELYIECKRRGFDVQDYSSAWNVYYDLSIRWYKDFTPTEEEIKISAERLIERDPSFYVNLLPTLCQKTY